MLSSKDTVSSLVGRVSPLSSPLVSVATLSLTPTCKPIVMHPLTHSKMLSIHGASAADLERGGFASAAWAAILSTLMLSGAAPRPHLGLVAPSGLGTFVRHLLSVLRTCPFVLSHFSCWILSTSLTHRLAQCLPSGKLRAEARSTSSSPVCIRHSEPGASCRVVSCLYRMSRPKRVCHQHISSSSLSL